MRIGDAPQRATPECRPRRRKIIGSCSECGVNLLEGDTVCRGCNTDPLESEDGIDEEYFDRLMACVYDPQSERYSECDGHHRCLCKRKDD